MERVPEHNVTFSVITVCRNAGHSIEKTIQSVLSQTHAGIEYIVIDGASTDNTLDIVSRYKPRIAKVISEPDKGIYDAMNKGIDYATGDIVCFINAGDYYFDEHVISNMAAVISGQSSIQVFHAKALIYDPVNYWSMIAENKVLNKLSLFLNTLPHPATFYTRNALSVAGKFNTEYKICADYEWYLRSILTYRQKYYYIDYLTTIFVYDGVSSINPEKREAEFIKVVKEKFSRIEVWGLFWVSVCKGILKALNGDKYLIKYLWRNIGKFF